jgi:hypothetical protein
MTVSDTLKQLKALGTAKVRAQNAKGGAGWISTIGCRTNRRTER